MPLYTWEMPNRKDNALMDIDSLWSVRDDDENDEDAAESNDGDDDNESENNGENDEGNEENDDAIRAELEVADRPVKGREQKNNVNTNQFILNYRDVKDSVRAFNGTDSYLIEWINDFEETAAMFNWNDLQMVFAKKSLKGVVKLFVLSKGVIKTWRKLKKALAEEFSTKISA